MLVDTHCHLDFSQFESDREEVLARARAQGVLRFINVGAGLESSRASLRLAESLSDVYATVGVHPHEADAFDEKAESEIRKLAKNEKVVGIGETGLDYYRNLSSVANQKSAFRRFIAIAKDLGLPLVIHSRQAEQDILAILKEMSPLRAVVHCFSSGEDFMKECLELGFYISFTCNITYTKARELREVAAKAALDRIMLETDAPYLAPQEERGKRNEPANVSVLARELSVIKNMEFEKICAITTENAFKFFNLK